MIDERQDPLWMGMRAMLGLPQKPDYAQPCNRCGFCCLMEQCDLSVRVFGPQDMCPALTFANGQSSCSLVSNAAAFFAEPMAGAVQELASLVLGISEFGTCDASSTEEETAIAEAEPPLTPEQLDATGKRVHAIFRRMGAIQTAQTNETT